MMDVIDSDGFRANVAIVLMRGNGEVFLARRARGGSGWQFPQGGIREGEDLEQALYRELQEEVGITREDVIVLGRTGRWLSYRLPSRYIRRNSHPLCIGQKQRWFLLKLKRDDIRFELATTAEPEFDLWRWASYWEPIREVVYFKQAVYAEALKELAPVAFSQGAPAAPGWLAQIHADDERNRTAAADR